MTTEGKSTRKPSDKTPATTEERKTEALERIADALEETAVLTREMRDMTAEMAARMPSLPKLFGGGKRGLRRETED